MSWKQAVGFLTVVFVIVVIQSAVAGPLVQLQDTLLDSGDYSNEYMDGEAQIQSLVDAWFNMGLVAIFLLAGVVVARIVRKELTRQGRQP